MSGGRLVLGATSAALVVTIAACGGGGASKAGRATSSTSLAPAGPAATQPSTQPATRPSTTGHSTSRPSTRPPAPGLRQRTIRLRRQPGAGLPHHPRHHAALRAAHARRPQVALCPLTGLRAPGGHVPHRAAVAVKVENLPEARPQWGLDKADIVFEEPVEGGITRFIAVFDCTLPDRIEPVRSARLVDPRILEPLGRMLFAYSGGIQPVVDEVDAPTSLLSDVGGYKAGSAYWRDPARYIPHNLVTSASALYAAAGALHYPEKPPVAIFSYGRPVKGGTPASALSIGYPLGTTTWTWRRSTGLWYRSYAGTGPALQGDGAQLAASNVVVMLMHEYVTQYSEDILGSRENGLIFKGSGPAWVFRDGAQFFGRWERPLLDHPTVFYEQNGNKITLTPGNTWVELVPDGLKISVAP